MNRVNLAIVIMLLGIDLWCQAPIYTGLSGIELEKEIVETYKPNFVEIYQDARRILLSDIYNKNNTITTFYSDRSINLPAEEAYPALYLLHTANKSESVRVTHLYPKSKGASTKYRNAYSDLYNLIPISNQLYSDHRTPHYKTIDDLSTSEWINGEHNFKETTYLSNETIKEYNELYYPNSREVWIEPKESLKGDVARSIFYFYTMYREAAIESDPTYFESMRKDLCQWHQEDPTDKMERSRNLKIALYQDNKVNPFILDHTLANRMYCEESANNDNYYDLAELTDIKGIRDFDPHIRVLKKQRPMLDISNINPNQYSLRIYAESGKKLYHIDERLDYFNTINMWNVKPGRYFVHLFNIDTGQKYSDVIVIN